MTPDTVELPPAVAEAVEAKLRKTSRTTDRLMGLLFLAVVFWVSGDGLVSILSLLGALLLTELGVYAVMRLADAVDTRQLALPFIAEQVTPGVAPGKQVLVMLAGPTLLMAVSIVAYLAMSLVDPALAKAVAMPVVGLALLWLLPLNPYTGWRLLNLLLFSRAKNLETLFAVGTALVLAGLAFVGKAWVIFAVAILQLFAVPIVRRHRDCAERVRDAAVGPLGALEALEPERRTVVLAVVWKEFAKDLATLADTKPDQAAHILINHARNVLTMSTQEHPSWGLTLLVLGVYVALGVYFVAALLVMLALGSTAS